MPRARRQLSFSFTVYIALCLAVVGHDVRQVLAKGHAAAAQYAVLFAAGRYEADDLMNYKCVQSCVLPSPQLTNVLK